VLRQKTHCEEQICKNGILETVQVVVKNSPFHLIIGATNAATFKLDFNRVGFEAFLVYDCDGAKDVDFVKAKPLDFKPCPSEDGKELDAELRIKVLSSQHEDMLFKIKIQGFNPITKEELPGLVVITQAIKVISKPEQLKKRPPSKKRTLTDMLVETVSRIEKKQDEQQRLIERMFGQQQQQQQQAVVLHQLHQQVEQRVLSEDDPDFLHEGAIQKSGVKSPTNPFEQAFTALIKTYSGMKTEEKLEIVRRLVRSSGTHEIERLSELLDLFWTEGLQKEPVFTNRSAPSSRENGFPFVSTSNPVGETGTCSCLDCPHRIELDRIDEFYKEFLSTGVGAPSLY